MPREAMKDKVARVQAITDALRHAYPDAHCELNYTTPLELLIATILSAQCTDKRVNQVTESLFKRYRSASDYASAPAAYLEQEIRPTGFFRNKTKNIQACCQALVEKHDGRVPNTMAELRELGGVGRKTANVVLGNAFSINEGIVVDTHVSRLSERLGFSQQTDAERIESDLMPLVPRNDWALFSHLLIWHGRRRCFARKPDCANCEVLTQCPRIGISKGGSK
jgi:endonuclease-3